MWKYPCTEGTLGICEGWGGVFEPPKLLDTLLLLVEVPLYRGHTWHTQGCGSVFEPPKLLDTLLQRKVSGTHSGGTVGYMDPQ
jgi:hypothetical protein